MPIVTSLRPTSTGRVAVHIDGQSIGSLSQAALVRLALWEGRELTDEQAAQLRRETSEEVALNNAYRLLAQRARSREEIRQRLQRKGHDPETVAAVLDRLQSEGLIDDAAFAAAFAHDKRHLSGWGAARIQRELAALGVAADVIAAVVHASADKEDEADRAFVALARRGQPCAPSDEAGRRRAYQFLLRRGFASDVAYSAVQRWSSSGGE